MYIIASHKKLLSYSKTSGCIDAQLNDKCILNDVPIFIYQHSTNVVCELYVYVCPAWFDLARPSLVQWQFSLIWKFEGQTFLLRHCCRIQMEDISSINWVFIGTDKIGHHFSRYRKVPFEEKNYLKSIEFHFFLSVSLFFSFWIFRFDVWVDNIFGLCSQLIQKYLNKTKKKRAIFHWHFHDCMNFC